MLGYKSNRSSCLVFHEFLAATFGFTCSSPIKLLGNLSRHTLAILVSRVNVVLFSGDLTMVS